MLGKTSQPRNYIARDKQPDLHRDQICADLLYDPVTFLDCLHTNCGACAKSWFASLSNIDAAKYTCPICRSEVRRTRHNPILQSLVHDFIEKNPDKDRSPEEKAALRKLHTPGGGVLPGEANTPLPGSAPTPPRAQPRPARHRSTPSTPSSSRSVSSTLNPRVSCSHCNKRVDYATRYRCSECDVITCRQCDRLEKGCRESTGHIQTLERLQLTPTRYIQTGIFCDICDTWCDDSRPGEGANSYFWSCGDCNNGRWELCLMCVSKGNCCSHELHLYRKTRHPSRSDSTSRNASSLASRLEGLNIADRDTRLDTLGYARWKSFNVTCDHCHESIPHSHSYLHCTACSNGQWDICMTCWTASPEASGDYDGDDDDDDGTVFRCSAGHKMLLLSQTGKVGTHKLILDVPHDPPDYVSKMPCKGHGQRNGTTGARDAVALKSHWPDPQNMTDGTVYRAGTPGERPWDSGGLLAFPEKAAISDVWVAFTEGEGSQLVEYLWGWYAGIGGLFPRDCVRFTD